MTDPFRRLDLASGYEVETVLVVGIGLPFSKVGMGVIVAENRAIRHTAHPRMVGVVENANSSLLVPLELDSDIQISAANAMETPYRKYVAGTSRSKVDCVLLDEMIEIE